MRVFTLLSTGVGLCALAIALSTSSAPGDDTSANKAVHELIAKECFPCHGAGGIGQIRLDSSERIVQHQKLITRQIMSGAMPPHSYESEVGLAGHARQLTDEDRLLIQQWRTASVIPFSPPATQASSTPVVALTVPQKAPIPAIGSNSFRAREVKVTGDFAGLRIVPNAPASLRYSMIVVVRKEKVAEALKAADRSGTLGEVVPEYMARLGQGSPGPGAFSVPKEMCLIVINHFKSTGKEESDGFRVELEKAAKPAPIRHSYYRDPNFEIPAKKTLEQTLTVSPHDDFNQDAELVSIVPEAKYYCEEIEVSLTAANGDVKKLYHTRRWDFSFAPGIVFAKPVSVREGDFIKARFLYRNDDRCRMNEGRKPVLVKSGTGPEDEVCSLGLVFSVPR